VASPVVCSRGESVKTRRRSRMCILEEIGGGRNSWRPQNRAPMVAAAWNSGEQIWQPDGAKIRVF
jgi:hypothetical protein